MAVFFAGYFLVNGVATPFFPVWLQARGLSDIEIANSIAFPSLLGVLLTPFAGYYADRVPSRRFAVITFTLPAVFVFLLARGATGFWPILLTAGTALTLSAIAAPPALALALTGVRRLGVDFGRMRMVGTISFGVANLAAGAVLGLLHAGATFWLILTAMVLSAAASFALPVTPPAERARDDAEKPDNRPSREVLGNRAFLALMAASGLIQASHAMLYSFGSIAWHRLGFSALQIGGLWSTALAAEVAVLLLSGRVLRHVGAQGLLILAAAAAVLRWSLFPLEPGFLGYALLQALHGLTFGANTFGAQYLIARVVPERMTASAQGIYAMFAGILLAATTVLAGPLYAGFGIEGFLFMVPVAGAGLALSLAFRQAARV
jgi:MFS transporter, PPP family, 3-phenylpropionic acid transporter